MEPLRYGILSTASIVPRFVNALRESGTGTAVAIASRDEEKARKKALELDIPKSYGSYEELLTDPDIDAVYVAMINSLHYQYAMAALQAGKHVICEKPMTLHTEEARALFSEAKKRGLFITEALKTAYLPVIADVKKLLDEKTLGEAHLVDFTSSCAATYNGWLHSAEAGGGALYGNAGYCLTILQTLFGKIDSCNGLATFGSSQVEEQCVLNMNIGQKILATSKISTNVLARNEALIFCDDGYIVIPNYWKATHAEVHYNNGMVASIDHPCKYELVYEVSHFNECIREGRTESPVTSEERTLETLSIMESLADRWRAEHQSA